MMTVDEEEQLYYEKIQQKLRELFNWEMSTDEIEDFLEAKKQADVEFIGADEGSGR